SRTATPSSFRRLVCKLLGQLADTLASPAALLRSASQQPFSAGAQPPLRRSESCGASPPGFGAPTPKRAGAQQVAWATCRHAGFASGAASQREPTAFLSGGTAPAPPEWILRSLTPRVWGPNPQTSSGTSSCLGNLQNRRLRPRRCRSA